MLSRHREAQKVALFFKAQIQMKDSQGTQQKGMAGLALKQLVYSAFIAHKSFTDLPHSRPLISHLRISNTHIFINTESSILMRRMLKRLDFQIHIDLLHFPHLTAIQCSNCNSVHSRQSQGTSTDKPTITFLRRCTSGSQRLVTKHTILPAKWLFLQTRAQVGVATLLNDFSGNLIFIQNGNKQLTGSHVPLPAPSTCLLAIEIKQNTIIRKKSMNYRKETLKSKNFLLIPQSIDRCY